MSGMLERYTEIVGETAIDHLRQLAAPLENKKVVHVNSTREGGGVAEILHRLVPMKKELGIDAGWEVITGDADFFRCTKEMHNTLQGDRREISASLLDHYKQVNEKNFKRLGRTLTEADIVFIHDPQPAALLAEAEGRKGHWIWRCHIDVSRPYRNVWKYLRQFVEGYDASIYSLPAFAQPLDHPLYIIPPSIDPLSDKNVALDDDDIEAVCSTYGIDPERPVICQISRFDRFKDPVGVIAAYRMVREFGPQPQLVLAGGTATDDPEGEEVLQRVYAAADKDPDIHILLLPPDAHRIINGLQRVSDIVLQKSLKEGFGLTVTEAMWKGKPVIGGNVGGIRIQVVNHQTGFLVSTPEGAAMRMRYLLQHRDRRAQIGRRAREFVLENYLLTRHLQEYLALMVALVTGRRERIVLGADKAS